MPTAWVSFSGYLLLLLWLWTPLGISETNQNSSVRGVVQGIHAGAVRGYVCGPPGLSRLVAFANGNQDQGTQIDDVELKVSSVFRDNCDPGQEAFDFELPVSELAPYIQRTEELVPSEEGRRNPFLETIWANSITKMANARRTFVTVYLYAEDRGQLSQLENSGDLPLLVKEYKIGQPSLISRLNPSEQYSLHLDDPAILDIRSVLVHSSQATPVTPGDLIFGGTRVGNKEIEVNFHTSFFKRNDSPLILVYKNFKVELSEDNGKSWKPYSPGRLTSGGVRNPDIQIHGRFGKLRIIGLKNNNNYLVRLAAIDPSGALFPRWGMAHHYDPEKPFRPSSPSCPITHYEDNQGRCVPAKKRTVIKKIPGHIFSKRYSIPVGPNDLYMNFNIIGLKKGKGPGNCVRYLDVWGTPLVNRKDKHRLGFDLGQTQNFFGGNGKIFLKPNSECRSFEARFRPIWFTVRATIFSKAKEKR